MTAVRLDFPLSADFARDAAIRPMVDRAVRFLVERVGADRLEAVILTGSLSRGEGSVILEGKQPRLLGDVEFLAILKAPFAWARARRLLDELGRACTAEFGTAPRRATIEYSPAGVDYLRRNIRPCIFAYDLLENGKVVWGRGDVLGEARRFPVGAIPPEDAIELVMNRMVELLAADTTARHNGVVAGEYTLVKTVLDLGGSVLASTGRYVSRYAERPARVAALLAALPELPRSLPGAADLLDELGRAARLKLAPTNDLLASAASDHVERVVRWTKALWMWEMRRLVGRPDATVETLLDLYLRGDTAASRLRGWVKLWTHPFRPRGALSPVKAARHFFSASPRRLTYAAALIAYFGRTGEELSGGTVRANALLPVRATATGNAAAVTDVWRWLIRNN
jgi:hypothetical protein